MQMSAKSGSSCQTNLYWHVSPNHPLETTPLQFPSNLANLLTGLVSRCREGERADTYSFAPQATVITKLRLCYPVSDLQLQCNPS